MSKEYLFTVTTWQNGNTPVQHEIEVLLPFGRKLRTTLPEDLTAELNRLITGWVKAEEQLAIADPRKLQHHDCCSCGSCVVTDHEAW